VVNRTDATVRRLDLKRGNPTARPARLPERESDQLVSARASWSRPVLYASFEHSRHHGATCGLAAFQFRRSAGRFHPIDGVS
jgi:hypothetical protein